MRPKVCSAFTAKYLDCHNFVARYRFIGYLINNSLRSNSLSDHAYFIERVPHEIVVGLIFSCKLVKVQSLISLGRWRRSRFRRRRLLCWFSRVVTRGKAVEPTT